jgi:hypothetical protein
MPECHDEDCDGECFQSECKNGSAISVVVYCLSEHGLDYNDSHKGNFGYVKREGSWVAVVIDLGVESFTDWDEDIYGKFDYDADEDGMCDCVYCKRFRDRG